MQKLRKKNLVLLAAAGLICAVLLTAVLCLPFSAAICRGFLPVESGAIWALLSAAAAVCIATAAVVRIRRRQALPTAGIIAGGYLLLCAILIGAAPQGAADFSGLVPLVGAVTAGGLLGAVMSIRKGEGKRRRKSRK